MRKRLFFIRLALLNTFKRRLRAALAIGGIALSAGVMVVLFGVASGLQSLVTDQVSQSESQNVVTVNLRNIKQIKLDAERLSAIKSISGVGDVDQLVGAVGDGVYHGIALTMPVYGVSSGYFLVSPATVAAGSTEGEPTANNIVISTKALEAYDLDAKSAVGKKISMILSIQSDYASRQTEQTKRLSGQEYTIVGVIDRGQLPVAYMPLENLTKNGVDSVSQLKVRVNDASRVTAVRESIEQMGFQTTSLQDSIDEVNRIFSVIQRILLVFGIITLVVTVFGTFSIITLTLMEETKQIGFLRIMGLQKHEVGFLFILQATLLTGLGAVGGVIGGLFVGGVINGAVQAVVGDTGLVGTVTLFKIPFGPIIMMLMLSIGLGWLMGMVPAKRAVLISPLEELRA